MRLSMWILADWLSVFNPHLRIQDGNRTLRNARLYSEELKMERSTVYIGYASDFIDGTREQIICANEHDMMFLEADDINVVLNNILDAFDYYNVWSDLLNERIKTDYSLGDLLRDSEPVMKRMMMVADASYYVYAQSGVETNAAESPDLMSVMAEHMMTLDTILAVNQDKRIRLVNPHSYILDVPKAGIRPAVRNIFFRGQHRGWLITDKQGDFTRGEIDVQDELGDIAERWIEYHQNQRELVEKSGVFLQILEEELSIDEDVHRRVESLGWRRGDVLRGYVFHGDNASLNYSLHHKLEQIGAGYSVRYEGNMLFILNESLTEISTFEIAFHNLLEKTDCFCGRSPKFAGVLDLKTNYELAMIAADYDLNYSNRIREIEKAALPYYFSLIKKYDKAGAAHPALVILQAYDMKHNTQLYRTLEIYLQCERNYIKTAAELHLHRNSLIYRIGRIEELTGLYLDSYNNRMHLLISYEIAKIKPIEQSE